MADDHPPAPGLTARLAARLERDFTPGDRVAARRDLEALDLGDWRIASSAEGRERIQAAILLNARGDRARLAHEIREVAMDWRDVLVAADLGFDDWADQIDEEFGPA
jgi:hypothetical protein